MVDKSKSTSDRLGGTDGAADQRAADEARAPQPVPVAARTPAAESGDPAVHLLLAERQTAEMNGDGDAVKEIDDQLTELGFESR